MSKQKFSLYVLSLAFLCSDNFSGSLFADSSVDYYLEDEEDYYEDEKERPLSLNQKNQKPSMNSDQMQSGQMNDDGTMASPNCCPPIVEDCCYCNVCPPTEMITPMAGPCVMGGWGVYLTADFTYWTAREQGTAFATTSGFQTFGPSTTIPTTQTGKVINPKTQWKPGFKAGLGLDFCHDGWDLYAEYTWFRSNTSRSFNQNSAVNPTETASGGPASVNGLVLFDNLWAVNRAPQFIRDSIGTTTAGASVTQLPFLQSLTGNWKLHLNVVDLALGRNFYISPRLTLRPHVGLKGEWQNQKIQLTFSNAISPSPSDQIFNMNNKFSAWGIGPRVGLDTAWHFARLFSLVGDVAFTGLFEHFNAKRFDYNQLFATGGGAESFVHVKNKFFTFAPVLEWFLGLRAEYWTECASYHFALDAGWESQIWFFQNQFIRTYSTESTSGTLGLNGLTVHARFDF